MLTLSQKLAANSLKTVGRNVPRSEENKKIRQDLGTRLVKEVNNRQGLNLVRRFEGKDNQGKRGVGRKPTREPSAESSYTVRPKTFSNMISKHRLK